MRAALATLIPSARPPRSTEPARRALEPGARTPLRQLRLTDFILLGASGLLLVAALVPFIRGIPDRSLNQHARLVLIGLTTVLLVTYRLSLLRRKRLLEVGILVCLAARVLLEWM